MPRRAARHVHAGVLMAAGHPHGAGTHSASQGANQAAAPIQDQFNLETALYVAEMSSELARMARSARLELVAYFLEMAALEARSLAEEEPL